LLTMKPFMLAKPSKPEGWEKVVLALERWREGPGRSCSCLRE